MKIIAYCPETIAPHQGMLVDYLKAQLDQPNEVVVRPIPKSNFARMLLALRVVLDALFQRSALLYFASFVSVTFALIPFVLRHPRWIYHSQDWISDQTGLPAKIEPVVVRHAPMVIWNEPNRAERAKAEAGRRDEIMVLPTYLPRGYAVAARSEATRAEVARLAGVQGQQPIIVFAGGGYSKDRLSDQVLAASGDLDRAIVLVFTGATRVPAHLMGSNVLDLGMLNYDRMMDIMASSDIGLLLYDYRDSFGHRYQQPGRLTEYLKGGLALIATPFPAASAIAQDTPFCTIVQGYDAAEISDALNSMASRIRNNARINAQIRDYAETEMAYDPHARRVLDAIWEKFG